MVFKHRAKVNEPFRLEIVANNLSPIAILKKIIIKDRLDNIVYQKENIFPFKIDCLNIYYIENVVIDKSGNYFDIWEFVDGVETKIIKSQFSVRNKDIPNFTFIPYAYIYSINYLPDLNIIKVILKTNDPYLTIKDVKINKEDDIIACYHEIAPDIYYIKIINDDEKLKKIMNTINEVSLYGIGYANKEYFINGSFRINS